MAIAERRTQLWGTLNTAPLAAAPLIEGTAFSAYTRRDSNRQTGGTNAVAFTGRKGARVTLPSAQNITAYPFVSFQLYGEVYSFTKKLDTVENGGIRFILVDGSGNYAGWNIYGSDIPGLAADGPSTEGLLGVFTNQISTNTPHFFINHSRTPDISSGTLDKTNITNIEFSVSNITSINTSLWMSSFSNHDVPIVTGTASNTFLQFANSFDVTVDNYRANKQFYRLPWFQQYTSQQSYFGNIGLVIGNGSTTTTLTESAFSLGLQNTYDTRASFRTVGPTLLLDNSNTRKILFDQSATDTLSLTDCSFASAAWWQWVLQGSGTATITRAQFWRFSQFLTAHGTYTDCAWYGGTEAVEVGTACTIVRGTVSSMVGHGVKITSAPGSYSNLQIAFDNNSTYDIEVGSGGAGTYNLSDISVIGSYTLKIRNDSATNAITVAIPTGITYSTSTAGGTITVTTPPTYQSVTVSGFTAGSRIQIYDASVAAPVGARELFNGTASSGATVVAGSTAVWTDTLPAVATRDIRIRISYVSGVTANEFIETSGLTCASTGSGAGITYPVTSLPDATYNSNAVNGSAVTGITFTDSAIDLVNCNIAGGAVTWPTIYAAFVYWNSTATGIANDFTYVSAPDTANYLLTSMKVKNTSAGIPLSITGGYGRSATTGLSSDIIDTSGGFIFLAPDHVVPYATGSGVTAGDKTDIAAAVLSAATATPIAADIQKVNAVTVNGTGTTIDPWGP